MLTKLWNSLENDEIQVLKQIKSELEVKVNVMAQDNINLDIQVNRLIEEIQKSKRFFEQLTEDLN